MHTDEYERDEAALRDLMSENEGTASTARRMLIRGLPLEQMAEYTDFSLNEIEALRDGQSGTDARPPEMGAARFLSVRLSCVATYRRRTQTNAIAKSARELQPAAHPPPDDFFWPCVTSPRSGELGGTTG